MQLSLTLPEPLKMTADDIITRLNLAPHPEGGHFRQTWISEVTLADGRASGTCIFFLLKADERGYSSTGNTKRIVVPAPG